MTQKNTKSLCNLNLTQADVLTLNQLGIDIFNNNRNYWFLRTQAGTYFDEFYFNDYIGIEWDDIVDSSIKTIEEMAQMVSQKYPAETRVTYVAGQIIKFIHGFKKGDIVLIPNKDSKIIAFGEILEDDIFVSDEGVTDPLAQLSIPDEDQTFPVLRKRRKVKWLQTHKREELDPHLQTFIYAHNTIVDLSPYALFIDRTLSNFYIKGDAGYFTLRVNRPTNIPFDDLADLFLFNRSLINFINHYFPEYRIERGEVICKIDVQSKGPIQFTGPIATLTIIGLICAILCGGSISINTKEGITLSSEGIPKIVSTVVDAYDVIQTHKEKQELLEIQRDYDELLKEYEDCKQQLELAAPKLDAEIVFTEESINQ